MKFLALLVMLAACDVQFGTVKQASKGTVVPATEQDSFCGVCAGYQNGINPYEIYLVLEDCTYLGLTTHQGNERYCVNKTEESTCYAKCLPRTYECKRQTNTDFCLE